MSVYRVGTNKSSTNVFPSVRPTLDLDFANTRNLDPRITYSRASGASYIGPDGFIKYAGVNEPRFTYDQNTGESLGLMIEDGGTNLLTRSQEFDDAVWPKNSVSILSNVEIAPDGTMTADKVVENSGFSTFKFFVRNLGTISSGQYTVSIFVKAAERFRGYLQIISSTVNSAIFFNLKTGTITGGQGVNTITKYPNGWYRISTSSSFLSNITNIYFVMLNDSGLASYTGDGVSGMYVWGAQLETQTFPITVPTSYIPTQASTRTRARDDTEIRGKNFSDFYNQNGGTVYSDITVSALRNENLPGNSFDRAYSFTNADFNLSNIDLTLFDAENNLQRYYIFGITENTIDISSIFLGEIQNYRRAKICISYGIGNIIGFLNNNKSSLAFPRKLITCDRLFLGKPTRFQATPYIIISRFTYYPRQLPEEQIRALTR